MNVYILPFDSSADTLVYSSNGVLAFIASMFLFCSMILAATILLFDRSAYVRSVEKITCVVYAVDMLRVSI